jgi:hypothetical protein
MSGIGDIIEISSSIAAPKTKPAQQGPAGGLALAAFVKRPQAECSNRRIGNASKGGALASIEIYSSCFSAPA